MNPHQAFELFALVVTLAVLGGLYLNLREDRFLG